MLFYLNRSRNLLSMASRQGNVNCRVFFRCDAADCPMPMSEVCFRVPLWAVREARSVWKWNCTVQGLLENKCEWNQIFVLLFCSQKHCHAGCPETQNFNLFPDSWCSLVVLLYFVAFENGVQLFSIQCQNTDCFILLDGLTKKKED